MAVCKLIQYRTKTL